jgi:hypothetical protein
MRPLTLLLAASFVSAHVQALSPIVRFERISGDRQIAVNTQVPPQPYVVRALDVAGQPVPNTVLRVGSADYGGPIMLDEFRFPGFNASINCRTCVGVPLPGGYATTDANGVASASERYLQDLPSAFPYGVRPADTSNVQAFWSVVLLKWQPAGKPAVVVEFFNASVGHYFATISQAEIDALERGGHAGWSRSTGAFAAWPTAADAPPGAVPVCRLWSERYTTHFYSADPAECAAAVANWPEVWALETREAFYVFTPDKATGSCVEGLQPMWRMYSNRSDPNHRYITDKALRDRMTGAGWRAEGYGPDAVMLCVPG